MTREFNAQEMAAIELAATVDEWNHDEWTREALEARVRHKMIDGMSFRMALTKVLAEVPREDDPSKLDKASKQSKLAEIIKAKKEEAKRRLAEI